MAGIQRSRKDEKKAKRDDLLLARVLVYFLKDRQYSTVIDSIIPVIDTGYASNLVIGVISLVFTPAARMIREHFSPAKTQEMTVISGSETFTIKNQENYFSEAAFDLSLRQEEEVEFDDQSLPLEIRQRINTWVEDMGIILSKDPSTVLTQRILDLIDSGEISVLVDAMTHTLQFFMEKINIKISVGKAKSYSVFILSQLKLKMLGLQLEEV